MTEMTIRLASIKLCLFTFIKKTKRLCSSKKKEEMLNIGVEGTK